MTVTVYGSRLSPFVEKVCRGLAYKGLQHRLVNPQSPNDLKRWNPTAGKMPVIDFGDERLFDSTFILRRLDERHPEPTLFAVDPTVAALQRQLEDWADESLYWYLMALRWSEPNRKRTARELSALAPPLLRPLAGPAMGRAVGRLPKVQGLGRLPYEELSREFAFRLDDLQLQLGDSDFFFADAISVADLSVFGQLCALQRPATPEGVRWIDERPGLRGWFERVESRTVGTVS